MGKGIVFVFFITINFLIFLIPKIMVGVVSSETTLFWSIWVNSLFFLFLILPTKASYLFEDTNFFLSTSKLKLISELKQQKKSTNVSSDTIPSKNN